MLRNAIHSQCFSGTTGLTVCYTLGQQSTANTCQWQQRKGRELGKKQKLEKVEPEGPAECSQCLATLRSEGTEASKVK